MQKYKWYWRVEYVVLTPRGPIGSLKRTFRPDVHFHCDVDFDPFLYMEDNNKVYGVFFRLVPHVSQRQLSCSFQVLPSRCTSTGPQSRHYGRPREVFDPYRPTPRYVDRTWGSDFLKAHPEHVVEGNAMNFISDNGGEEYNLCHCKSPGLVYSVTASHADTSSLAVWSNFEVADMDFWRAPAYTAYVDYLEASGGFYYEVRTSPLFPPSDIYSASDSSEMG